LAIARKVNVAGGFPESWVGRPMMRKMILLQEFAGGGWHSSDVGFLRWSGNGGGRYIFIDAYTGTIWLARK